MSMANERLAQPTNDITSRQRQAAEPTNSVWVQANAGSGKTHVLTERVLRLLLTGTAPENLLCLTYTKAAAAEMRRRVAERLGKWAVMDDVALSAILKEMEGEAPNPDKLNRARTLFGHALETPGGLKINTIHAYCEAVLQRFPLEAGVPFGFTVIEESEQADLINACRDAVLAQGVQGLGDAPDAVRTLFAVLSDHQIEEAIGEAIAQGNDLTPILHDPEAAKTNLAQLLKLDQRAILQLEAQFVDETLLTPEIIRDIVALTQGDPAKSKGAGFADLIARLNPDAPTKTRLTSAFLTGTDGPRKRLLLKKHADARPDLVEVCQNEQNRLLELCEALTKRKLYERSSALIDVLGAVFKRYEARKRARGLLDFDDLIAGMQGLLTASASRDWVRYKLDAAITHILVDESQDTNPEQWQLIKALVEEFFSGDGIARAPRTLFVVGDRKQSIYSFQGAKPEMFVELDREFGARARQVDHAFDRVSLRASFRTLENILFAVDKVCSTPEIAAALLTDNNDNAHESARADKGGTVTLWPPVQQTDIDLPADRWPLDSDAVELRSAARQLAERITGSVQNWIEKKRPLQQRGRAVVEDDVLILVQSRGPLFQEIIRALKRAGLKSPGADRLSVSSHIAVRDLMALADVLLNPADDLGLAAVLRSPLFDVTEDALFALASPRAKGETLWSALSNSEIPSAQQAYQSLTGWRARLDFERPYDFFAQILYAEGGLRRFHARLGEEVDDVLAEFLDLALAHESATGPGLQGFLASMRKSAISIKRELSEQGGGVRVMTVHGAKGLEAPIVILADAANGVNLNKAPKVFLQTQKPGPLLIHASGKKDHTTETDIYRQSQADNQSAEYWRKLYVGMTRAEDELYVTGVLTKNGKLDGTWYDAMNKALADESAPASIHNEEVMGRTYPAVPLKPKTVTRDAAASSLREAYVAPPLPKSKAPPILQPSRAHEKSEFFESTAQSLVSAEDARKEGIAIHALLQHLTSIPETDRTNVAARALEVLLPGSPARHEHLANKALGILSNAAHAHLFGPDSRAEVPFLADIIVKDKSARVAGRLDRLIVTKTHVLAVDFKSDANPPSQPEEVSPSYLTQLGLYHLVGKNLFPKHQIDAAIFWTSTETLMPLPEETLNRAMSAFSFE